MYIHYVPRNRGVTISDYVGLQYEQYKTMFQIEAETKETEESTNVKIEEDVIPILPQGPKQKTAPTSTVTASEAEAQEAAAAASQDTVAPTSDTCLCSQSHDTTETHLSDLNIDNNIETGGILPLLIDNKALSSENSSDYTDMDTVD